jgi:hypothetical protein
LKLNLQSRRNKQSFLSKCTVTTPFSKWPKKSTCP